MKLSAISGLTPAISTIFLRSAVLRKCITLSVKSSCSIPESSDSSTSSSSSISISSSPAFISSLFLYCSLLRRLFSSRNRNSSSNASSSDPISITCFLFNRRALCATDPPTTPSSNPSSRSYISEPLTSLLFLEYVFFTLPFPLSRSIIYPF